MKYEYRWVAVERADCIHDSEDSFNQWGAEGWEVVCFWKDYWVLYKRQVVEDETDQ